MKIQSAVMCCLLVAVLITVLITRTEAREETQRKLFLRRQAAAAADIAMFNADNEPVGYGGRGFSSQFHRKKRRKRLDAMENEPVGYGGRGFSSQFHRKKRLDVMENVQVGSRPEHTWKFDIEQVGSRPEHTWKFRV